MNKFHEQKLERLNSILISHKVGFIYDFLRDRENGLIFPFFAHYMDGLNQSGLDFAITSNQDPNAGVIYNEKIVFVSHGLIDRICKLSELIYSSGELTGIKKSPRYYNLDQIENSFTGFNNEDDKYENGQAYLFIFDTLLKFIVSHELGHLYNGHGNRLKSKNNLPVLDDVIGHNKINQDEVISSHARELVADNYGFNATLHRVEDLYENYKNEFKILNEYEKPEVIFTILVITCYFKMMDGESGTETGHFESSHPEHAMRACSIIASYIEKIDESNPDKIRSVISIVMSLMKNIFHNIDEEYDIDWSSRMIEPEMLSWHKRIEGEYSKWVQRSA